MSKNKEHYADQVMSKWGCLKLPPRVPEKTWTPKNPEVVIPRMEKEVPLDDKKWDKLNFPSFVLPESVETHVNTFEWSKEVLRMEKEGKDPIGMQLMTQVLKQLSDGVDSEVKSPGNRVTVSRNYFPEPLVDIPRIGDSIASEVKNRHMAGPYQTGELENVKINSFLSIKKPDGSR